MNAAREVSLLDVFVGDPLTVDADLLVVPMFEGTEPIPRNWMNATGGLLEASMASGEFRARLYESVFVSVSKPRDSGMRLAVVGLGPRGELTTDRVRRAAAAIAIAAREKRIRRLALHAAEGLRAPETIQAIAEGLTLAEFDAASYKTDRDLPPIPAAASIVLDEANPDAASRVRRGRLVGLHCNLARQLANEPGNVLTPSRFEERLLEIARDAGLGVEVLHQPELERQGMELLLAVGRASAEPPRMVIARYEPDAAAGAPVLGLVGKGITFDSGGISIKPALDMHRMKDDMTGAATVMSAMAAIARLGMPIRVLGVMPIAENMLSGRAMRPGDVLRSASGKTVEVVNTDSEGRLILADALWYAQRLGATHLVDVATLTAAISVALGTITTGLFGTPAAFVEHVRAVADRAGDQCWPLPLFDEYREQLRSDIADMINTGGRIGGAITAAMFLKEFTGGLPWVHLDIAGTAWLQETKPYMCKGPTGVGVRTLVELAASASTPRSGYAWS